MGKVPPSFCVNTLQVFFLKHGLCSSWLLAVPQESLKSMVPLQIFTIDCCSSGTRHWQSLWCYKIATRSTVCRLNTHPDWCSFNSSTINHYATILRGKTKRLNSIMLVGRLLWQLILEPYPLTHVHANFDQPFPLCTLAWSPDAYIRVKRSK